MTVFKTLLLREWMQHQRGWLILAGLPFVVMLLALTFGSVHFGHHGDGAATAMAGMLGTGALGGTLALTWIAVLLQAPGLARRDVQDRSIEFWLSLPTSAAQSLSATLLAHLLLVPLFALACGLLAAAVLGPVAVLKAYGWSGVAEADWGLLASTGAALVLRLSAGIVLFTLWLSPLILGLMVASAWLKRWGVPAVIGLFAVGGGLERAILGSSVVHDSVLGLLNEAGMALVGASGKEHDPGLTIESPSDMARVLPHAMTWSVEDLLAALKRLARPGFLLALAGGAGMFALLVLRRRRGA